MTTTPLSINGISEIDFTNGVSSVTVTGDVATITFASGSGTVTHTGALTSGQLIIGNGVDDIKVGDLTGDVTTSGSTATTVAKIDGNAISLGTLGSGQNGYVLTWVNGSSQLQMQPVTAGTVTHTGTLTSGRLIIGNGSADITVGDLSGDVTTSGSTVTTVAKIDGNPVSLGTLGAPQDGYVMTWVNGSSQIQMVSLGALGGANASQIRGKNVASSVGSAGAAQDGYALIWVNANNDFELVQPVPQLQTVAISSGSLAAGAKSTGTATIAKGFKIQRITVNHNARVQLYQTAAKRDTQPEPVRPITTPPTPGTPHGVIEDWYLDASTAAPLDFYCAPPVLGYNGNSPVDTNIYWRITNIGLTTQTISVTLYYTEDTA